MVESEKGEPLPFESMRDKIKSEYKRRKDEEALLNYIEWLRKNTILFIMRVLMNKLKIFLIVILCSFFTFPANSHQISQSFSNWTIEEKNITAVFSVAPRYITLYQF